MTDMDKNCIIHTLANGMRAVYCQRHGNVAYCGVAVNAGSRDEGVDRGLAHFVEHTIFKGTSRRRAWHILNRMELVGGELNAYTSKEETLVYSLFPKGNMPRAMELIADLVQNSVFTEHELEKEREVVLEEILSYRDTPSEAVYDDFEEEQLTRTESGDFLVRAAFMPGEWLISFILSYGAHAKVVEPKALADAVRRELEKISALYKT